MGMVNGIDVLDEDWNDGVPKKMSDKTAKVFERNALELDQKDSFRVDYLRRLSNEKVWLPKDKRTPEHQSVIIFDWDDTLLCTSFLSQAQGRPIPQATKQQLMRAELAAQKLLESAVSLGHTFIITNAEKGWVEESAARFMPSLKHILEKVQIISARSEHEGECTSDQWKNRAFLELGRQLPPETMTNLVSIGDSKFELEAAKLLGQQFSRSFIKTVKFQEHPTPEELVRELETLVSKLQSIVEKPANMRIRLTR